MFLNCNICRKSGLMCMAVHSHEPCKLWCLIFCYNEHYCLNIFIGKCDKGRYLQSAIVSVFIICMN